MTLGLFEDEANNYEFWTTDESGKVVPAPIKEYPLTDYWEVMKYE